MSEFFKGQADYFFFVYGLTFIILGTVCFIERKSDSGTFSLSFLGLFGFAYGLRAWLGMLELVIGDQYWSSISRLALMLLSFIFLLEFCRIGYAQIKGKKPAGRWIFIPPLLLVISGGVLYGYTGLEDSIRLGFGLGSTILAAIVLYLWGRKIDGVSVNVLFSASLGMACFGLTNLIVTPDSAIFAAQLPTETTFMAITGIPIEFFRAGFIAWIAGAILSYEIRKMEYPMPRQSLWLMNLGFTVLVVLLAAGFILTNYFDRFHQQNIRDHITVEVNTLAERMSSQIHAWGKQDDNSAVLSENIQAQNLGLNNIYAIFLVDAKGKILLTKDIRNIPEYLWSPHKNHIPALFDRALINGEKITFEKHAYVVGRKVINREGWSLIMLERETFTGVNRLFAIIMTLLICTLTLVLLVILQKNILTELKLRHDHQELRKLSEAFEKQSITDTLTGANNRLKFDIALQMEMKAAIRYQTPLALLMYDIDHFKKINDTYGHPTGDHVLKELTALVAGNIRASDLLARWGARNS
ncbi:hypothetical protein CAP31_07250 [Sulfuriferula sp. AH1]|nr:hypothetical protein CAP31_07250 [Sulfuriferula sp. AH1]